HRLPWGWRARDWFRARLSFCRTLPVPSVAVFHLHHCDDLASRVGIDLHALGHERQQLFFDVEYALIGEHNIAGVSEHRGGYVRCVWRVWFVGLLVELQQLIASAADGVPNLVRIGDRFHGLGELLGALLFRQLRQSARTMRQRRHFRDLIG